jgi:putative CocE/NonD family hydrolase
MLVNNDIACRMSDGTWLYADVYRPAATGRFPVIITRTPYQKETERFTERAHYFAERGYVYVIQDVRGKGKSEGTFYPFFNEARDGYDTLTWAAEQHWSNGCIGTIGASYGAWTQWLTAILDHPNLHAMLVEASPPDFFQCVPYERGALSLTLFGWLLQLAAKPEQTTAQIDWQSVLSFRPLSGMDRACGRHIQAWQDWLVHDREDEYWRAIAFNRSVQDIHVPVFHRSGWYDDVLVGTLANYSTMCRGKGSRTGPELQKLCIGPWPHRLNSTSKYGKIDFGERGIIDLFAEQMKWFDFWLKGLSSGVESEHPVRYHLMGANRWCDDVQWPPSRASALRLFLHSTGGANTRKGNGRIDATTPGAEPADEFTYDPAHPAPFITDPGWTQLGGPDDYAAVEEREDVLVYSTTPLEHDIAVVGPITVYLFAASSAVDTDFVARLLDVRPDGYVMRLNDGIVRAQFRHSLSDPVPIVPNRVYEYCINCWATAYVFGKGHRIRLEISSSEFPRFDPNLNTGRPIRDDEEGVVARQTIYHDREHLSHLIVYVLAH